MDCQVDTELDTFLRVATKYLIKAVKGWFILACSLRETLSWQGKERQQGGYNVSAVRHRSDEYMNVLRLIQLSPLCLL